MIGDESIRGVDDAPPSPEASGALPASIEISLSQARESERLADLFPENTRVYLPDIDGAAPRVWVEAARRLRDHGYRPVPHVSARRLVSAGALGDRIIAMTQDGGVDDILLIGGDPASLPGEYASSMDVLDSGILDKYGVRDIGVAGHPEESSSFPRAVAFDALRSKQDFGERTGARMRIVTQFGFDGAGFVAWADSLASHGIDLPVHVGVAGPASLPTLLKYSAACGVGNSIRFLNNRGSSLLRMARGFAPDSVVTPLEVGRRRSQASPITQIHVFAFGGMVEASRWLHQRGSWCDRAAVT